MKKISEHKLNKMIKIEINKIKEEINVYKELFFQLFEQKNYNKAIIYINLLKNEINNFPDVLKNYLINVFFPEYKKFFMVP